jgi:aminoglycoside 2'-N-acetyltransferase I
MQVELAHTAQLEARTLHAARALLDEVFEGDFSARDWEHALGGVHALVWDGAALIGHGAVVMRRLRHGDRALRAGYVESVGVHPGARRRGHGAAIMRALGRVIHGAYELGALGATDEGKTLYEQAGWRRWDGPLSALTPTGVVPTPDEQGAVYVLEAGAALDFAGELTCDWRDGDLW